MERIVLREPTIIPPFAEPARDLRILNKPLWLYQRDLLKQYCKGSAEIDSINELAEKFNANDGELLIYRDNLFFNAALIDGFIAEARSAGRPCQIAFRATNVAAGVRGDPSIERHALQLCTGITRRNDCDYLDAGESRRGDVHLAELYYFPSGPSGEITPLVIDTRSHEMGYYHIPSYMASKGDLTFQIPVRALLSVESWLHVFMANIIMGVFSWAAAEDTRMSKARLKDLPRWTAEDWRIFPGKVAFLLRNLWERVNPFEDHWRNHFYASRPMVKVGKRCSIDPSAVIHGPTLIGDDVNIGPGVVISNSLIGSNVTIMQGSQVMLSVVSDRCYLPFNGALFMTSLMENSMVAQNSTLQLCVVGRNTFIGANNSFTDFNLQNEPIKVLHRGQAVEINMPVLGSAVGHNVKIGSGFVVYPGRMIGSNAVIIFDNDNNLIRKTVSGHDLDDIDEERGEPRRIIYHWPNVFHDPAPGRVVPATEETPTAQSNGAHPPGNGVARADRGEAPEVASEAAIPLENERPPVGVTARARRIDR